MMNTGASLISVIVPVYNAGRSLNVCVESIISQTYRNIEIILIDDGSTDEDAKTCDSFAASDNRIKVIHKQNAGVSAARNTGLSVAAGEYIFFCDSDDYLAENTLELLHDAVVSDAIDMSATGLVFVYSDGKHVDYKLENNIVSLDASINDSYSIFNSFFNALYAKLYRKSIIDEYSVKCNENISILEDGSFVLEYLSHCSKIACIEECCYFYVQDNPTSLMNRFNENAVDAYEYYYAQNQWLIKLLNRENLNDFYYNQQKFIWYFVAQIFSRSKKRFGKKKELLKQFSYSDAVADVLDNPEPMLLHSKKIRKCLIMLKNHRVFSLSVLLSLKYLSHK